MKTKNVLEKTTCPKTIAGHLRTACATLWLLFSVMVQAQDYTYTTDNGTITITGYSGSGGEITIPDMIDGLPVTSIGNDAFFNCSSLTGVTIPNSVTSIGDEAFIYCYGLISVAIPGTVTNLGNYTFASCISLTSITIPDSITSIGNSVFSDCSSLTSITIPGSVTSIGDSAASGCSSLTSITIPGSVTNIWSGAFSYCTSLTGVLFRGNAPALGLYVFDHANTIIYYLPGTTGWGSVFGDRPTRLWNPQIVTGDASFGVRTNQFGFNITGASGLVVVVEACTNLANAPWSSVGTNTLTGYPVYFGDPEWVNYPGRFYRLSLP